MEWLVLGKRLLLLLLNIFEFLKTSRDRELGRLEEQERAQKINENIRDRISRADPDLVSDDEIVRE